MDEIIEIWDASGKPTGTTALKSEAHKHGWFHPTVHLWLYTRMGQVLLQKRAAGKDTFPGLWDVSVAGHILSRETPMEGVLRETQEEIGLVLEAQQLEFLGRFTSEQKHPGGIIDREFQYVYIAELPIPLNELTRDPEEVGSLELRSLLRLAEELWGMAAPVGYVPHSRTYYKSVITSLQSRV
ncbi:NUDIX hydrolase [Robiginitalea sp.]|uniref:NUDIX hydrolase n=1 Tax=Robiginitalea sp. TaxID=1902411 RepID=UPI003C788A55